MPLDAVSRRIPGTSGFDECVDLGGRRIIKKKKKREDQKNE
jgi:hypothetical protein